jgi:hypothetical protein
MRWMFECGVHSLFLTGANLADTACLHPQAILAKQFGP